MSQRDAGQTLTLLLSLAAGGVRAGVNCRVRCDAAVAVVVDDLTRVRIRVVAGLANMFSIIIISVVAVAVAIAVVVRVAESLRARVLFAS